METGLTIEEEICAFTGEPIESVRRKMGEGIHRTARLFRSHPGGMEAFYRESDAYLYELSNTDEDPFKSFLADRFGACMAGRSALEYGCGIGTLALKLAGEGIRVTACDINEVNLGFLRQRVARRGWEDRVAVADPEAALNPESPYQIVTCFHVLEHVSDPQTLLGRLVACLEPGGLFLGIAPFDMIYEEFPEHLESNRHFKLEDLCEEVGLTVRGKLLHYTYKDSQVIMVQAVKPVDVVSEERTAAAKTF